MIYMINSFEFQGTSVSFSLNANSKPKSRKLEKTIPLIQIVSLTKPVVAVRMEITYRLYVNHEKFNESDIFQVPEIFQGILGVFWYRCF